MGNNFKSWHNVGLELAQDLWPNGRGVLPHTAAQGRRGSPTGRSTWCGAHTGRSPRTGPRGGAVDGVQLDDKV
jgi:hypothetical protein